MRHTLHVLAAVALLPLIATVGFAGPEIEEVHPGFDVLTGSIDAPGEMDAFPFPSVEGSVLKLLVKTDKGDALVPDVEIWGPDFQPLPGLDATKSWSKKRDKLKVKKFPIPATGRMFLLVTSLDDTVGGYQIKLKLKQPKKLVDGGEVLVRGEESSFDLPSSGPATAKILMANDKKWSDADGPTDLEIVPLRVVLPDGTAEDIAEYDFKNGKVKFDLDLVQVGVHQVVFRAAPRTRGGYTIKVKYKYAKHDKRTVADTDILIHPLVYSVDPNVGYLDDVMEDIQVEGFFFKPGASVFLTRATAESQASEVRVLSGESLEFDLDLSRLAAGVWSIEVRNADGGHGKLPDAFTVKIAAARNLAITPREGHDAQILDAVITGENLRTDVTVRLFRDVEEIPGTDVRVIAGTIYLKFDLRDRTLGLWDLEVTNLGAPPTVLPAALTIVNSPPIVTGFTPGSTYDPQGLFNFEVTGARFDAGASVELVRAGEAAIEATNEQVSATTITGELVVAGATAGAWGVLVRNPDGKTGTLADVFTVFGAMGSVESESVSDPVLGRVDAAVNVTDEEMLVVWAEKNSSGDYTVRGQRFDLLDGTPVGSRIELKTGASGEGSDDPRADPVVEWSPKDNRYLVVWEERLPDSNSVDRRQIWARLVNADGSIYGNALQITDNSSPTNSVLSDSDNTHPGIAYDPVYDEFRVVCDHDWRGSPYDPEDVDVIERSVSGTGTMGTATSMGQEYREDTPAIAWNEKDQRVLVVYRWGITTGGMSGTVIEVTHTFAGYGKGTAISTIGTDTDPDVAYNPADHEALVVWVRDGTKILAQRIDPTSYATIGSLVTVAEGSGQTHFAPRVIYNPVLAEYLIVWTRSTASGLSVRARRFGYDHAYATKSWQLVGSEWEMSSGTGEEAFGCPLFVASQSSEDDPSLFDVYLTLWCGSTTQSGSDYLSDEILFRRWK